MPSFPMDPDAPAFVYFARHGETEWNKAGRLQGHTDIPLNARGQAQARALGEALRGRGIARIVTSDLSRARETAEIVAFALELAPPVVDARLRERGFGSFEGRTRADIEREDPEAWSPARGPSWSPPGGESIEALSARILAAALDIAATYTEPGAPALVVSHGAAIRALLLAAVGLRATPLGNGTVYRLTHADGGFRDPLLAWSHEELAQDG